MSELQAVLECQVELFKFFNIDLFQRGYYQVRTTLKTSPKTTAKIDVTLTRSHGSRLKPAYVLNGSVAVSKTFQILYRKEDVELYDVFTFKIYMLVDINKIEQYMQDADFQLIVELWFTEEDVRPETILQCVSTRSVHLHIRSDKGVHHYLPLQFDYFHLSAVALNIHATLLALHPSYISLSGGSSSAGSTGNVGNSRASSSSSVNRTDPTSLPGEFSTRPLSASQSKSSSRRVQQAFDRHRRMCRILLCVYESLQSSFETLIAQLPKNKQIALEHVDCQARFDEMIAKSHRYALIDEEDMVQATQSDIATLCGQNFLLWMQYLELVTFNKKMTVHLAREHHTQRVKRFAEAFFVNEFRKQEMIACFDASVHGHVDIVNQVRSSSYYQSIPPLVAECSELDGDAGCLPIVFEDIYTEQPAAIRMTDAASEKPPESDHVELRHSAAVAVVNNNPRPESGFSILGGRTSRLNRDSVSSIASSDSSSASRKTGVTLRRGKTESFCRPTAQVRAQVATDSTDCALVGYRKIDTSGTLSRPVVELGTLTTPQPMDDEVAALVGTGVVMQPSLLFNAISMPTLCSAGVMNREPDSSFRGSMPTLNSSAELDTSTVEVGLQPYWRGQQQKAQLLAQHSTGGSETVVPPECGSGSIEDGKDSTSVSESKDDSTPDSEQGSADSLDKNATLTDDNVPGSTDDRKNDASVSICDVTIVECEAPIVDSVSIANNLTKDQAVSSNSTELEAGKMTEPVAEKDASEATGDVEAKDSSNDILKSDPDRNPGPTDSNLTASSERKFNEPDSSNSVTECKIEPPSSVVPDSADPDELNVTIPREDSVTMQSDEMTRSSDKCTLMELIREENRREQDEAAAVMTGIYDDSIAARLSGANEHSRTRHDGTSGRADGIDEMDGFVETDESSGRANDSTQKNCTTVVERPSASAKRLVPVVDDSTIFFIGAKETLRKQLGYTGHFYSDFPSQFSVWPYFWPVEIPHPDDGIHLVVCVHGLDGNSTDLRLVRTYLELALPGGRLDFLMSERNQTDTFADFEVMTDRLVNEIMYHIDLYGIKPTRISFIGHSLGNLIIRSAMSRPQIAELLPKLHTFLSLSGPHLGTLFNNSGLVNMGMWLMQKWKKSGSLLQLSLKDHPDPRQTFLYKLSQKTGLEFFRNILLVGSQQDRYVPYHSSRIELCKAAMKDSSGLGAVYVEMVNNILQPIIYKSDINFIRYDIYHALPSSTTNNLIGRAAHIAVLDSEIFIEKFVSVAVLKYFI